MLAPALAVTLVGFYLLLARYAFKRAWSEFRKLQQTRVQRAAGLLSPILENARHNPFEHLPTDLLPGDLKFESILSSSRTESHPDPLLSAVVDWEQHHHQVSHSFIEALSHVAHHRLVPHHNLPGALAPIGEAIQRLVDQCPEPSLQKELRMAHEGLKTGAEQNLEYVSRHLRDAAHKTKTAFHKTLGSAHLELSRCQDDLLASICAEAKQEIQNFLDQHRGFKFNPLAWGRQAAYFREFEELGERLEEARLNRDLSQVALIVMMIVEDEDRFIQHIRTAGRMREAIHRKLSSDLRHSSDQLHHEAHSLTGWVSRENQMLQSTVSHQIILHLENWSRDNARHDVKEWIVELTKLRDQDPDLSGAAA